MTYQHLSSLEEYPKNCPQCGKGLLIVDNIHGELLCSNCGYIVKENEINYRPEWRAYTKEEREEKARVGIPSSLAIHDQNLATKVGAGKRFKDASGRPLKSSERKRIQRMQMWNRRSQTQVHHHNNLLRAFSELNRLADKLKVSSSVIERSAHIYRKALKKDLVKGRSISDIITASLYAACRETDTPRTLKDIVEASGVKRKNAYKSYRLIVREMNLKMPVLNPVKNISKISSRAGIPEKISRKALMILEKVKKAGISAGKDPMGLAATALYIACATEGEPITQKTIANAAGITEVTIRNHRKSLQRFIS